MTKKKAAKKSSKKSSKKSKKPARKAAKRKPLVADGVSLAALGSADRAIARAPGRRDTSLQVRMPGAMRSALVKHAHAAGTTAGAVIRDACSAWLAARGVKLAAADVGDPRQLALGGV